MDNKSTNSNAPIHEIVASVKEFKNEDELLDYFGISNIEIVPTKSTNSNWIGGNALVSEKNKAHRIRVPLWIREGGTYETPIQEGGVESPVDRGEKYTGRDGVERTRHNVFLSNAVLRIINKRANKDLDPDPEAWKRQQAEREQKQAAYSNGTSNVSNGEQDVPFDVDKNKSSSKKK